MGFNKTSSMDVDGPMGAEYSTYSGEEGYAQASVTPSDGELMETLGSIPNSTQDPDVRHRTRLRSDESTPDSSSPIDHAHGEGNPEYVFQDEYDNGFSVDTPVCYHASAAFTNQVAGLIDSGANGGLANPKEMRSISYANPGRFVNITGVGNMKIPRLRIGTFAAKVQTQDGRYIILMFHEYGELSEGRTIHSKIQLRDNGCAVYDEPESLDGKQCLITLEGHNIPIDFENGLAYIKMTYPDEEDLKLPTIIMTRDVPWDPKRYDQAKSPHVGDGTNPDVLNTQVHHGFDQYGDYIHTSSYGEHLPEEGTTYERLFGEKPTHYKTPLEPNSHPELDTTEFCDEEETKIYQSLVGASQWATSLGRFDICVHVMTLSSFRAAPRKGHLEMIKRFYGYLSKMSEATIRYRTDMPNLEDLNFQEYDWSRTVYADSYEEYPASLPVARGQPVQQLTYVDANLYHDMLSGKSVTALLHLLNQTPIDWFSKKQSTVETATFGSENVAARTAIEQMRTIKFTLLYLGVPVVDRSILVGDNKSVVDCATQPHSRLSKRHLMLSYHFVREAIASGNYAYVWIHGKLNPADILSKHWAWKDVWPFLQPLLYWQGDTNDCPIRLMSGMEA